MGSAGLATSVSLSTAKSTCLHAGVRLDSHAALLPSKVPKRSETGHHQPSLVLIRSVTFAVFVIYVAIQGFLFLFASGRATVFRMDLVKTRHTQFPSV